MAYALGRSWLLRHFNMTRTFLSPHTARIDIPGGIPFDAIELKDATLINPANLALMLDSGVSMTFFNYPFAEEPEKSLIGMEDLMRDNDMYTATFQMDIDKSLHVKSSPIFPLYIQQEVGYIGNSSVKIKETLHHNTVLKPYVNCEIQYVYIDSVKKCTKAFPDDWKKKYQHCQSDGVPLRMTKLSKPQSIAQYALGIRPSDTDYYGHTNFTSYIKFCCDALFSGILQSSYKEITMDHITGGLQSLIITYMNEALLGDTLIIDSWEDKAKKDTIHFEQRKGDTICCQATLKYYRMSSN